jgi:DNA-binding response OmpR family regulator
MSAPLGGRTVIVVENEILIALDIQSILAKLFPDAILLARSLSEAWDLIEQAGAPRLAILDVMLVDGKCFPLARHLQNLAVPIVFLTGASEIVPDEFAGYPVIDKPFMADDLIAAIKKIIDNN